MSGGVPGARLIAANVTYRMIFAASTKLRRCIAEGARALGEFSESDALAR